MEITELEKILLDQKLDFANLDPGITRALEYRQHYNLPEISVITGVRRCGKSTLLKQIAINIGQKVNIFYLDLDDPRLSAFRDTDFELSYQFWMKTAEFPQEKKVIFIDEIQNVDRWEKWASFFAKKPNHKIFITGSNSKLLSSEFSTFLTGRHLDIHLTPLSYAEKISAQNISYHGATLSTNLRIELERELENYIQYGGFPRAAIEKNTSYLAQYYDDIINKDIIIRHKIRNKPALHGLAKILATETTRLTNHSKTAKILGLSDEATVRKYCRYFTETYLYSELRCFSPSIREQTRSQPKYICVDQAMARINGFWKQDDQSRSLEIQVYQELSRGGFDVYYWLSKKNYEIDYLIVEGVRPKTAIQVSYSINDSDTFEREVRALKAANVELGITELIIVTRYERKSIKIDKLNISVLPFIDWALGINLNEAVRP